MAKKGKSKNSKNKSKVKKSRQGGKAKSKKPTGASRVVSKPKRVLNPTEVLEVRALSETALSANSPTGSCWFQDSGGADFCVPLRQDVCKNRGGVWTPGPCPNQA
jgi:hypothetical protein